MGRCFFQVCLGVFTPESGHSEHQTASASQRLSKRFTGTKEMNGAALRWPENHPLIFRTSPKRPKLLEASRMQARCNNRASCSQNRTSLGGPPERAGKRSTATALPPRQMSGHARTDLQTTQPQCPPTRIWQANLLGSKPLSYL